MGKKHRAFKIMLCTLFLIQSLNCKVINAHKEETNINFKRVTIENGLSQSNVTAVHQDSKGYIWIGTNDGLNKYNGYKVDIYKYARNNDNTLSGNAITDIKEDKDGNLWVATKTGLNKIEKKTNKIIRYLPNSNCNISNYNIKKILIGQNGDIIIGTKDGLNKYDKEKDDFIRIYNSNDEKKNLTNQDIYSLAEDMHGNYWIGTYNGINMIDNNTGKLYKYIDKSNKNKMQENNFIYSLYADDKGYLWIGTHYGGLKKIDLIDGGKKVFYPNEENHMPGAFVRDILRDSNGNLWIATDRGFTKFNEKEGVFSTYKSSIHNTGSIISDDILCITEDKTGTILIGTTYGLCLFNPDNKFNYYKSDPFDDNSLSSDSVTGIYEDNEGLIWVGTYNDGLNIVDRENEKVTRIDNKEDYKGENYISSNIIRDIVGIDNEVWIATKNGLNKYDKNTNKITIYNEKSVLLSRDILSLFIDSKGVLWIGTNDGLFTFDRKGTFKDYSQILKNAGVKSLSVQDIAESKEGKIWLVTKVEDGLISLDKNKDIVKIYKDSKESLYNLTNKYVSINSLAVDDDNNLWLATDSGLIKLDKESKAPILYTEEDGLANNFVYGILFEDKNNLWLSTNYGISKLDLNNKRFINYDSTDGIQGNEFNQFSYFKSKSGEFFFGGINGLTSFRPENIKLKKITQPVQIESIYTNNGGVPVKEKLKFSYKTNQLKFDFFLPDYRDTKRITYAYQLEGLDKNWNITEDETSTTYSNLKPGIYKFTVAARNSSGKWGTPTSIKINIKSTPWTSPAAYAIYFIALVAFIYLIWNRVKLLDSLVKQRTSDLNEKLIENEQLYNKLLQQEKYKNNYFINLSHELRTPLNIILATQELLESYNLKEQKVSKEKTSYYMGNIKKNCKRLSNLIDNIVDTSKIESDSYIINIAENDIVYLVEETALSMKELSDQKEIELIIEPHVEEKIVECDSVDIERVIINLISNAIKFTDKGGTIIISLWDYKNYVKISVKDTGIGIEPKNHKSIFDRFSQAYEYTSEVHGGSGLGLTLSKHLIELHNGTIWVDSEKGKGSEFKIVLPVKHCK